MVNVAYVSIVIVSSLPDQALQAAVHVLELRVHQETVCDTPSML